MTHRMLALLVGLIAFAAVCGAPQGARSADAPKMTKEELKGLLGNPDVAVLDVRTGGDWRRSDRKIAGAVRENPNDVDSWADKYPKGKTIVLYCS